MKRLIKIIFLFAIVFGIAACSRSKHGKDASSNGKEDILVGVLKVAVDESVYPLIKEQEEVFQSAYPNAKLEFVVKPERLAVRELLSDSTRVAILARELDKTEGAYFAKRSITPKVFPIWTDGIVVLSNTKSADTSVTIGYLVEALKGESKDRKKIVFDNLNSSVFRSVQDLGNVEKPAANFVEEANGGEEVLESVANDTEKVGLLGYNQYLDLIAKFPNKNNIRILSVQNTIGEKADKKFYKPNQSTIAAEEYPLRRTFYVLNYQPNMGLGIGFSAFLTGDRGQRIVLKSGLVPAKMPGREIIVRDNI